MDEGEWMRVGVEGEWWGEGEGEGWRVRGGGGAVIIMTGL